MYFDCLKSLKNSSLQETLFKLTDELRPHLILTTGGTGISPDDVTPEVEFGRRIIYALIV